MDYRELQERVANRYLLLTKKKGLKNHIISVHFKNELLPHLPTCGEGKTGVYQCSQCEKTHKDKTDAIRHLAITHEVLLKYCKDADIRGHAVADNIKTNGAEISKKVTEKGIKKPLAASQKGLDESKISNSDRKRE